MKIRFRNHLFCTMFGCILPCLALLKDSREGDEKDDRSDNTGDEVSDSFGEVNAFVSHKVGKKETERNPDDDLAVDGQKQGRDGLSKGNIDVLQSHLDKEPYASP